MMLTSQRTEEIAAQLLDVAIVKRFTLDDRDENVMCFQDGSGGPTLSKEETKNALYYNRFCIVDVNTGKGVVYHMGADMESEYRSARADFSTGLQTQKCRLEISDIRDWGRTRRLLQGLTLDVSLLICDTPMNPSENNWLRIDLGPIQECYQQQEKLIFDNVDINGHYEVLFGGRYYQCFDFTLYAYDEASQSVVEEVPVQENLWQERFENFDEEDEELFWEYLSIGPAQQ